MTAILSPFRSIVVGAVVATLACGPAMAHAHLHASTPAAKALVGPPSEIRLEFSEGVEPKFSKVTLTGPGGDAELGAAKTEGSEGAVLVVPIARSLAPGAYTVHWSAVSVDSHHTQGTFGFAVK